MPTSKSWTYANRQLEALTSIGLPNSSPLADAAHTVPFLASSKTTHTHESPHITCPPSLPSPSLFVQDGEFVGGCDIITADFQSGDLAKLLTEKKLLEEEAN